MKNSIRLCLISLLISFMVFITHVKCFSMEAREIVKKSDYIIYGDSLKADLEIKVYRDEKVSNSMKMNAFLKGNKKFILFFYYPPRTKNRALLKNNDDLWFYIPNNRRFMKIGCRQRMGSSEFNYGDILNVNLYDDYDAEIMDENSTYKGHLCYKLQLTAKRKDVTYARIICYIRKDDFAPIYREFFTKSGKKFKEMEFDKFDGARPMLFIMSNALNKKEYSTLEYFNLETNIELDEMMFTKSYVQRRR